MTEILTKEQNEMLSDIENYNVLCKAMAKEIGADRVGALIFAIEKQNELLSDFMDSVGFQLDKD